MDEKKQVQVSVRLPAELFDEFKVIQERTGRTQQWILKEAIKEYIRLNGGVVDDV